ncbi:YceI family protein [Aurantivibrio infirmus]
MFTKSLKKIQQLSVILICSVLLISCDRILAPGFETEMQEISGGKFALDKDHATLLFKINHLGFSTYIGRFNDFEASLDFDPENVANSSLEVIIDAASIDVDNPEFAEDLRGKDWFNVEQFPQIVFRTTSLLETTSETSFVFQGDLTLLETTAPVTLNVNFHGGGRNFLTRKYTLGFSGSANFKRSDFGLDNMVSFGVGDDIELEIHVEFQDTE